MTIQTLIDQGLIEVYLYNQRVEPERVSRLLKIPRVRASLEFVTDPNGILESGAFNVR